MGPVTLWRAARHLLDEDEDLRSIEARRCSCGEKDTLVPLTVGEFLRAEIPNSRLLVLEKAAHVPMFDRPAEFDQALLAFLAGREVGD